jgi:hypothetical protein
LAQIGSLLPYLMSDLNSFTAAMPLICRVTGRLDFHQVISGYHPEQRFYFAGSVVKQLAGRPALFTRLAPSGFSAHA